MVRSDCRDAIEAFVNGDFARVHGLPAGCGLAELRAVLEPSAGEANGNLGEPTSPRTIRYFHSAKQREIVRAWFAGDRLTLIDVDFPTSDSIAAYVAALGEPEARLDYPWQDIVVERGEYVWPARGVVAAASAKVIRAGLFAPGTLADYRRDARYIGSYREEP